jgi:hypothetical protein
MKQTVLIERPPVYERCDAQFKIAGKPILFAWGDTIFNPEGVEIPPELFAHEAVHGKRQLNIGIEHWWDRYLDFPVFRFAEEELAHRAEYQAYARRHPNPRKRMLVLDAIAERLSGPLYGNLVTFADARAVVANPALRFQ